MPAEITVSEALATFPDIPKRSLQHAASKGLIPGRREGNKFLLDGEAVRLYAVAHQARRDLEQYSAEVGSTPTDSEAARAAEDRPASRDLADAGHPSP